MQHQGLPDQSATDTQGFEKARDNVLYIDDDICPVCFRPFNELGRMANRVNVFTNRRPDQWCAECAEEGIKNNTCVKESTLSHEEKKQWVKHFKNKAL